MNNNKINHGRRLSQILTEMEIGKLELAKRLQIAPSSFSHWLKEYKYTDEKIERICSALGITVDKFLEIDNDNTKVEEQEIKYNVINNELSLLKKLLDEKERTIQILLKQYCDETKKD